MSGSWLKLDFVERFVRVLLFGNELIKPHLTFLLANRANVTTCADLASCKVDRMSLKKLTACYACHCLCKQV